MQLHLPTWTNAGTYGIRWQLGSSSGDTRTVFGRVAQTSKSLSNASEYVSSCCWTFPGILTICCCLFHVSCGRLCLLRYQNTFSPPLFKRHKSLPYWLPVGFWSGSSVPKSSGHARAAQRNDAVKGHAAEECFSQPSSTERHWGLCAVFMECDTACK